MIVPDMLVRPATPEDGALLVEFLREFRAEGLVTVLEHRSVPTVEEETAFIRKLSSAGVMLVALLDRRVIGCLTAEIHPHPQLRHSCELGIGVLRSHRSSGVGSHLIASLLTWASTAGQRRVELSVFANNTGAIELYRGLGFIEEGRRHAAVRIGERYEDIIQMVLVLLDVPPA